MATLEGKTVLIVGGSSGLGFGVASASLVSLAAHVIIASSSSAKVQNAIQRLEEVIKSKNLEGKVTGEVVDATDSSSVKALITKVGEVDHLVWTSGDPVRLGFLDTDLDKVRDAFDVRFWGPAIACQSVKIRPGGSITLTGGQVIVKPLPTWSIAAGISGAADSLVRGLAVDLAPIRVNLISPGAVKTEMWDAMMPSEQQNQIFNAAANSLLVKHVADAEEIAEAYLFAMKYLTGQRIEVDGGYKLV